MMWFNNLFRSLREDVRRFLYARARRHVLVIGDSHIRVFEHEYFLWTLPHIRFDIVYVPGATATGVSNSKSQTNSARIFDEAVAAHTGELVLVHLGEVDTAYTLWKKMERNGGDVEKPLARAVRNYCTFLGALAQRKKVLVLSACLPTLDDQATGGDEVAAIRESVKTSRKVRTELALRFNAEVAAYCEAHGIDFLSLDADVLSADGLLADKWINRKWPDHHYARGPFARLLAKKLVERFKAPGN